MKELEEKVKVEEIANKQQEHKEVFIGNALLKRGHKCWEYNCVTHEITPAQFEITAVSFVEAQKGLMVGTRKVVMKKDCLYFNGLNKKSAIKQYNNLLRLSSRT